MPSFTKQGQGFADTASVKGWPLQAPAELNLAGSFMWQQIQQWQQRWSPAATAAPHPADDERLTLQSAASLQSGWVFINIYI